MPDSKAVPSPEPTVFVESTPVVEPMPVTIVNGRRHLLRDLGLVVVTGAALGAGLYILEEHLNDSEGHRQDHTGRNGEHTYNSVPESTTSTPTTATPAETTTTTGTTTPETTLPPVTTTTGTTPETTVSPESKHEAAERAVIEKLESLGFARTEFNINEATFDLHAPAIRDAREGSFAKVLGHAIDDGEYNLAEGRGVEFIYAEFLLSDTAEGKASRDFYISQNPDSDLSKALQDPNMTPEKLVESQNIVVVQFLTGIKYRGNTLFTDGKAVDSNAVRSVAKGDIAIFFASNDGAMLQAVARGACANPQNNFPIPENPHPVTTTTTSTSPEVSPSSTIPGTTTSTTMPDKIPTTPDKKPPSTTIEAPVPGTNIPTTSLVETVPPNTSTTIKASPSTTILSTPPTSPITAPKG